MNTMKFANIAAAALVSLCLSGCGNIQKVISFSTPYKQPESGDRARIRIISFRGMVRAVPNSSCIDWRLPGAGVMVVSKKGFVNVNDQNLDMPDGQFPKLKTSMGSVAVSELYIPAGKPIAIDYMSDSQQTLNGVYGCFVQKSFVPVVNEDYEVSFSQTGKLCQLSIVRLTKSDGVDRSSPVILSAAPLCHLSDLF
jgi:hypothetical protein